MTRKPQIVVVGPPAEAGLRCSLVSALRRFGCGVSALDLAQPRSGLIASAAVRHPSLGLTIRRQLRRSVDALAETGPSDLVLVLKGALLDRHSVDHLRSRFGSPVVCWNPDSPFDNALSNSGSGIPQAIREYDMYVTWANDVAERLSAIAQRVLVIPFAWDPDLIYPVTGDGNAQGRIVFVGTCTKERAAWLHTLARMRPLVFGDRWPKIDGVEVHPPVRGDDYCRVVGEARWNLNLLRPQNAKSHNMRTFELVGADGNQVAPLTSDHKIFLRADSRTVLFSSPQELRAILQSDPEERPPRPAGLLDDHTYCVRVGRLLSALGIS